MAEQDAQYVGQDFDALMAQHGGGPDASDTTGAASGGFAGQDFDQLQAKYAGQDFDELAKQYHSPQPEGPGATFGREAAHGVLPAAGGFVAGAGAGALAGSVVPGWGTVAGAIVGGLAGAYATDKAQEAGLEALGYDDSQQRAANAEANPKSSFAGQLAPAVAAMRPDRAAPAIARAASAGLMGGIEAGQELYNEGTVSPGKVFASGAAGALLPSPNRVGRALESAGQRLASKVPGRPNVEANPAAVQAQDEAEASQQPNISRGASTVQPAPSEDVATVGNPQSRPERSERTYPKGQARTPVGPDMLTSGDFPPDVAQALQKNLNDRRVDTAPRGELPGPENPNDIDQSLKQAPIETGFPQAPAAAQPTPEPAAAPRAQGSDLETTPRAPAPEAAPRAQEPGQFAGQDFDKLASEHAIPAGHKMVGDNVAQDEHGVIYGPVDPTKPASYVHPEAKKVAEVRTDVAQPTAAQAEAGNFAKGHPGRLFGREVSIETAKGGVREDTKNSPPKWRVENFPYDYGEFLGTKGADGDRVDVGVVCTGDRHFVIDQKDPETGKFDEHKVMAYAKDPLDSLDQIS